MSSSCRGTKASTRRSERSPKSARRIRLPGGGRAVSLSGLHRGLAGAAQTDPQGQSAGRGRRAARRGAAAREDARAGARIPRHGRGDPGAAGRRRAHCASSSARSARRARWPTHRVRPEDDLRGEDRAARGDRRGRAAADGACGCSASGWPRCRFAGASATTSRKARRSSSASTSCAARWSRSARSSARTTRPPPTTTARKIAEAEPARRGARAGRARGRAAGADGRAERRSRR